jgi:hypothetical protein
MDSVYPQPVHTNVSKPAEPGHDFWRPYFSGLKAPQFPTLPSNAYKPKPDKFVQHVVEDVQWSTEVVTMSTGIRTALAILVSWLEDSPDIIIGIEVPRRGRTENTASVVPLRIVIDEGLTVGKLLERVQRQVTEMESLPFEQLSMEYIRLASEEANRACQVSTLLLTNQPDNFGDMVDEFTVEKAIVIGYRLDGSSLRMNMAIDSGVITESDAHR